MENSSVIEEGRKSQVILTCEKSSKYGENEHVSSDTTELWNCMLGDIPYCCGRQWNLKWVVVKLFRQRFKQCAVLQWTMSQQEQLVPECALSLVQSCQRLMQTR